VSTAARLSSRRSPLSQVHWTCSQDAAHSTRDDATDEKNRDPEFYLGSYTPTPQTSDSTLVRYAIFGSIKCVAGLKKE